MNFEKLISSGLVMKDEAMTIDEFGEERYWPVGNVKLSYVGANEETISYFSYDGTDRLKLVVDINYAIFININDEFSLYVYKFEGVV